MEMDKGSRSHAINKAPSVHNIITPINIGRFISVLIMAYSIHFIHKYAKLKPAQYGNSVPYFNLRR